MKPNTVIREKNLQTTTPPGLKRFLVALLILTAVSGYALNVVFIFGGTYSAALEATPSEALAPITKNITEQTATLLEQAISDAPKQETELSFQGTMMGENGKIALVNNAMVARGATIHRNIKVLEITERSLTVECLGETNVIAFGESATFIH